MDRPSLLQLTTEDLTQLAGCTEHELRRTARAAVWVCVTALFVLIGTPSDIDTPRHLWAMRVGQVGIPVSLGLGLGVSLGRPLFGFLLITSLFALVYLVIEFA